MGIHTEYICPHLDPWNLCDLFMQKIETSSLFFAFFLSSSFLSLLKKNKVKLGEGFQARVQEFVRGGEAQNLKAFFFFAFQFFFWGGGPAQKIDEKMIFSSKKVAKLLKICSDDLFFCFSISRGGARPLGPPPPGHAPGV